MARSRRWTVLGFPVAILMVLAVMAAAVGAPGATAQEGDEPHPAHIHSGTCEELGDIVAPLNDVTLEEGGGVEGAESAIPANVSETEIELGLADILAAPHAINVHESEQNIQNYVACGNIGGVRYGDTIQFGLRELNGSGMTGVAAISGDQDGSSNVVLYVAPTGQ